MICAESATHGRAKRSVLQPLFEKLLKGSASIAIVFWLAALVPYRIFPLWGFTALAVAFVALAAVFWRQLIRLHSRFEIELRSQLAESPFPDGKPQLAGWPKRNGQWKMNLGECTIKENTQAVARPISELPLRQSFSCTIVSIERQGVPIPNPGADTVLYPNDKVLLLGRDEDLRRAERWLNSEVEAAAARPGPAGVRPPPGRPGCPPGVLPLPSDPARGDRPPARARSRPRSGPRARRRREGSRCSAGSRPGRHRSPSRMSRRSSSW